MTTQSSLQKGFAVVEALLLVTILAIIGFAGAYVYHVKQSTDTSYNSATTAANTTVTGFARCAKAGNSVVVGQSTTCTTESGVDYIQQPAVTTASNSSSSSSKASTTKQTTTSTSKPTSPIAPTTPPNYGTLDIPEWGIHLTLTLPIHDATYHLQNDRAYLSTTGLDKSGTCTAYYGSGSKAPLSYQYITRSFAQTATIGSSPHATYSYDHLAGSACPQQTTDQTNAFAQAFTTIAHD